MWRACLVLLAVLVAVAPAWSADGHSISSTETYQISEHGYCQRVSNGLAGGEGLFVPTKHKWEWINSPTSFVSSTPAGVSLAECLGAASLRFKGASGSYLNRTFTSTGDRQKFTYSLWVKRGAITSADAQILLSDYPGVGTGCFFFFTSDDRLEIQDYASSSITLQKRTNRLFRDPSAWYHVVLAVDTTQSTAEDRVKLYVNGGRETSFAVNTNPSQNLNTQCNRNFAHFIGRSAASAVQFLDGYLADVNFVNGQQLEPTSFGEFDADTEQWVPKEYSGGYGTNGFHLNFDEAASPGLDSSGNGNNWTPTNFSTTSGYTYDPKTDSPGSEPPAVNLDTFGNTATLDRLSLVNPSYGTLSNGNLVLQGTGGAAGVVRAVGTVIPTSGKWYAEATIVAESNASLQHIHIVQDRLGNSLLGYDSRGQYYNGSSWSGVGAWAAYGAGAVLGFAINADDGEVSFYRNNVLQGTLPVSAANGLSVGPQIYRNGNIVSYNFGQQPFVYTPPVGFKAMNTYNLPEPTIVTPTAYFKTVTYTGNGIYRSIGNPPKLSGGATISNSLRFNDDDNAYLSRTPGGSGNRRTWTWSGWVKRGNVTTGRQVLFGAYGAANNTDWLEFGFGASAGVEAPDSLYFTTNNYNTASSLVLRDSSAWVHAVVAVDTTQAAQADRIKAYINGREIGIGAGSYAAISTQNVMLGVNGAWVHSMGKSPPSSSRYFDGYLADLHFVDGQALAPTSFGEFNNDGVWVPKVYSGAYGTNGFHLDFANSADLGNDVSGNSNDWTPTNLASTDQVADTPTNNFVTFNPSFKAASYIILSEGNLGAVQAFGSGNYPRLMSTAELTSGKWYWETKVNTNHQVCLGIKEVNSAFPAGSYGLGGSASSLEYCYAFNGNKVLAGSTTAYGAAFTGGDVIGVAFDADNWTLTFYKNGSSQGLISGVVTPGRYSPAFDNWSVSGANISVNFGQGGQSGLTYDAASGGYFAYAPPTGFKALSSSNLAETDFVPDLVWIKGRNGATDHALYDTARGATLDLASNSTAAETVQSTGLVGFNAGGFNIGSLAKLNTNGATYVAWMFKEGVTPGFDVVTYAGTGGNTTVPHSLGAVPAMMIFKSRGLNENWRVYHKSVGATQYLGINSTIAATTDSTVFNNTEPTSTVFSLGSENKANGSGQLHVGYLFAEVPGFSDFGSYTGNGSTDGPFIYTGFKPAFVLVKQSSTSGNGWQMVDAVRAPYNPNTVRLHANDNTVESESTNHNLDILSNGFKLRTSSGHFNANAATYVYAAFAEAPFKYANAR